MSKDSDLFWAPVPNHAEELGQVFSPLEGSWADECVPSKTKGEDFLRSRGTLGKIFCALAGRYAPLPHLRQLVLAHPLHHVLGGPLQVPDEP